MKTIVNNFRTMQLHNKALCIVYALALLVVGLLIGMEKAHAQSGNIYAVPQAQVAGNVYEAVVLQVSMKEVEARLRCALPAPASGRPRGCCWQPRRTPSTVSRPTPWACCWAACSVNAAPMPS